MTNLENTVRPFAPVQIHPLAHNFPAPLPPGVVECKLGGAGGTTTSFTFDGQTGEVKSGDDMKETSRSSTKVRVENPEDSSQYVEYCRADSVTMKKAKEPQARTSSFDAAGGAHGSSTDRDSATFEYQYPKDEKACVSREPPKGGKC